MNDSTCNKTEQKVLDEFMSRINSCNNSVSSRADLINDISNRLNGSEPAEDGADEKQSEPITIFEKLNNCISNLEHNIKRLEVNSDKLNEII